MGCCTGLSKCVLLLVNTVIFVLAAASLGVSVYLASDQLGSHMVKSGFVKALLIAAMVMMIISLVGCRAALARPSKRCSRYIYLLVLLAVAAAQIAGAALLFNLGNVLQKAHDKGVDIDVPGAIDNATENALRYLHDEVGELYAQGSCTGGAVNSTTLPVGFVEVHCEKDAVDEAFRTILRGNTITTKKGLQNFQGCVAWFTPAATGTKPSAATQAFCSSMGHITEVAQRYVDYLMLLPVCMTILTLILLLATTVLLCRRSEQARQRRAVARQGVHLAERMV